LGELFDSDLKLLESDIGLNSEKESLLLPTRRHFGTLDASRLFVWNLVVICDANVLRHYVPSKTLSQMDRTKFASIHPQPAG